MACVQIGDTCFTAGDTITIDWQYTTDEGVAIDLTGATAEMQLLESITDVASFITMTGGIVNAVNGSGTFSLTKVQSQTLLPIGSAAASKKYTSKIRFTYADTTTKSIAGINVSIEQSGIR
jgi:hypothetical protein